MALEAHEIPAKMQVLIKKEDRESYILDTIDVPEPEGDEVLIKVNVIGICGSDIVLYEWNDTAKSIASIPFIPGHECAGTVVKCGPKSTINIGDRVGIENHFYCGKCYQCMDDHRGICSQMGQYGHGRGTTQGSCSQYSVVSSKYCYVIKSNITAEEIALLEPLGVAHNAIEQLKVAGDTVLVIGCGSIGLLAISVAKVMGAKIIVAADIKSERQILAKEMGADIFIDTSTQDIKQEIFKLTDNKGIGRIVEMSGAEVMINTMFQLLRKGGHLVMVGLPKNPLHIENAAEHILLKAMSMKTIYGRGIYHTWERTEELVAKKQIDLTKVISHRLPMAKFEEAFQMLFSGQACKILLYP